MLAVCEIDEYKNQKRITLPHIFDHFKTYLALRYYYVTNLKI